MSTRAALPAVLCLTVVCLTILAAGSATTPPEEDPVVIKLNDLDRRLERLEQVLSNQSLLELSRQVQAMQTELRSLRGRVEEVEHHTGQLDTQQRSLYGGRYIDNKIFLLYLCNSFRNKCSS